MLQCSNVFDRNYQAYKNKDIRYIINQGGTSCFAPETLINTSNGYKPISQVQIGDFVLSYNEKYKKFDYEKVKNVFRYKNHKETYKVKLNNGNSFIATSDHKFFVEGGCISLKSMIELKEKGEIQNARGMETDTEFQQIRGVKFGENKVNKLQEFWQSKNIETCTCKRRIFKNNVIKRLWKILQLDCSQIYNINIFRRKTTKIRNKSQRRKQIKQCNRQFGICNKIREFITRIQTQLNNSETWLSQWQFKTNRGTSKRNKTNCSKWWQILWKKATCGKIWCFGMLHKRNCKSPKEYVARCLSIDDILSYEIYNQSVVYDIEVENNHNYCIYAGKDILVHNSTKTFSTLQLLTAICLKYDKQIDIVGLSVPHLKSGVLNDMPKICEQYGIDFSEHYKESDRQFKAGKGTINFLAFDKLGKAHGGRRDILYMNEANHLNYNIVEQLMVRTRDKIFIDYNPTGAFWVHTKILKEQPEKAELIKSTYKDNPFLEQEIIEMIESKKGNNNFWRVYGLGELGIAEGLIFDNFEELNFDKNMFDRYYNGIDWGFSQDPFAFVRCAIHNDCLYICDEIYQRGLLNPVSAPMVKAIIGNEYVYCDCAEPKSIAEYQSLGVNALPCQKGAGSVETGIKHLQYYKKIYIHPDCPNALDNFRNYQWKRDKNGQEMRVPEGGFDHVPDAIRYALNDIIGLNFVTAIKGLKL